MANPYRYVRRYPILGAIRIEMDFTVACARIDPQAKRKKEM
jgi:hypothetical protein